MYVIIIGCGRMGSNMATDLSAEGHDVVVVDKEKEAFKRLGTDFNGLTIVGTGIDEDILKKADIEKADAFVALTNSDNVNIMAAQIAKEIFKVPEVIARIYDPEREYSYHEFGLETVNPTVLSTSQVKRNLSPHSLHKLFKLGSGEVEVIDVKITPRLVGIDVQSLQIPSKFKIIAVMRGTETLLTNDHFVLEEGDTLVGAVSIDALGTLRDMLKDKAGMEA